MAVPVLTDRCGVADGVEVMSWMKFDMPKCFSQEDGVEIGPLIVEAKELPP
jgi:hypothetical protein